MIPQRYLEEWKTQAPWPANAQVEQDLIITRALVEIFSDDLLKNALAFRGGTALHKLYLQPQARYSEDIDLVQINFRFLVQRGQLSNIFTTTPSFTVLTQAHSR
ncbi:MAG: Nucleotidyl transferase, PF08843 family [Parcubacteria group bacterium GW2011_GWB2_40_8]|nr:MAG: Nucleotidyl transferase, PF08843 family [Parcubacteria group bacterium GW2011_GWB2_40_8]